MQPDTNAAKKPTTNDDVEISPITSSPLNPFMMSSKASPKIGGITIKKENCARFSFLLPNKSPVAIVLPERDRPGRTAQACAKPIIKASRMLMFSLIRGFA